MNDDRDTMIRASVATLRALRMAAMEVALARQELFSNDDERIMALIDHWQRTKPMASAGAPEPALAVEA